MKAMKAISLLLVAGIIMIGVCGCMAQNNSADAAYQIAIQSLKRKYNDDFMIDDLERKDSGIFRTKEYIGTAYPIDSPNSKFTIWVNTKDRTVVDSFECVQINEIANAWVAAIAQEIWPGSAVDLQTLLVSKPSNSLGSYSSTNIESYFRNEFSGNRITLTIPNYGDYEKEADNISKFLFQTNCITNGLLCIKYTNTDFDELAISLSANEEVVRNTIIAWRDRNG